MSQWNVFDRNQEKSAANLLCRSGFQLLHQEELQSVRCQFGLWINLQHFHISSFLSL